LEKMANEEPLQSPPKLSTDIKVERGLAPDAGFAESAQAAVGGPTEISTTLISAARRQGHEILELTLQIASLNAADIASLLAVRMKSLLPYDALAVYRPKNGLLLAEFASGENSILLSSLIIPLGEGLSGWVAQNHKPILNGNPTVEPGYLNDPKNYSTLRSALALPLEGSRGVAAVLVLYRAAQDAFTPDDLRIAEAMGAGLGAAFERVTKPRATGAGAS
jgi:GAF domain-containing protein